MSSVRVCQMLSNYSRDIVLFRFDTSRQVIYLLARGNGELEIEIYSNGLWEFVNDES